MLTHLPFPSPALMIFINKKKKKSSCLNNKKLLPSIGRRISLKIQQKSQILLDVSFYVLPGMFVQRMRMQSFGPLALRQPYLWAFLRVAPVSVYVDYFDYFVEIQNFAVDDLAVDSINKKKFKLINYPV